MPDRSSQSLSLQMFFVDGAGLYRSKAFSSLQAQYYMAGAPGNQATETVIWEQTYRSTTK